MLLNLTDLSDEPLHRQISRQLADKIIEGDIRDDTKPLSLSELARSGHVSVNTVKRAFLELEQEGLLEWRTRDMAAATSLTAEQKRMLTAQRTLVHNSPLSVLEAVSKKLTAVFDPESLRDEMETALKRYLLAKHAHFATYDDCSGTISLLPSNEYPMRFFIKDNDPIVDILSQRGKPLEIESVPIALSESELLRELIRRDVTMIVPLTEAGQFLGFIALSSKMTGTFYSEEEASLIGVLASQFIVAHTRSCFYSEVKEKRLMEDELVVARRIQADLLPEEVPANGRFSMAVHCTPSRVVGGDFYDCVPLDENRYGLVVADACGNGMPAAMLISQTHAMLRSELNNGNGIQRTLANMNRQTLQFTPQDKFVTLFYGEFDKVTGEFHYANAGHNYPILMMKSGTCERLQTGGLALGMFAEATYETGRVVLEDGDVLFLFTDGLTEAMDSACEEYGEERLITALHRCRHLSAGEILKAVLKDADRFCGAETPQDDRTILVLKMNCVSQKDDRGCIHDS